MNEVCFCSTTILSLREPKLRSRCTLGGNFQLLLLLRLLRVSLCEILQDPGFWGLVCFTFWLTKISSSPSMYCSGRFCFTCRRLVRCSKSCLSTASCSLFVISLCRMRPKICLDSSSSFRSFLSFSALWASLPRVLRICRTSRLRKQTYGSPSSVSAPVSNLDGCQW